MNHPISDNELANAQARLKADPRGLVDLRPLPSVTMQISNECRRAEVDTRALARLVEGDPAFAIKVLSVVNSSLYGFTREITTIDQALVVLGRTAIAQLALSIAAQQVYNSGDPVAAEARMQLFRHSLGVAAVASSLIQHESLELDTGTAFLTGILHDIGKLVLLDVAPQTYLTLLENPEPEFESVELERQLFRTDHSELGAMFGDAWGLTHSISHAIAHHHSLEQDSLPLLTKTIGLADQLARHWGIGQPSVAATREPALTWLDENEELATEVVQSATEQYYETKALLLS
jgi:putative nucleotidyltransferase with HDIG domain